MKSNDIKVYSFRIDGKELKRTIGDESGTDHEEQEGEERKEK